MITPPIGQTSPDQNPQPLANVREGKSGPKICSGLSYGKPLDKSLRLVARGYQGARRSNPQLPLKEREIEEWKIKSPGSLPGTSYKFAEPLHLERKPPSHDSLPQRRSHWLLLTRQFCSTPRRKGERQRRAGPKTQVHRERS